MTEWKEKSIAFPCILLAGRISWETSHSVYADSTVMTVSGVDLNMIYSDSVVIVTGSPTVDFTIYKPLSCVMELILLTSDDSRDSREPQPSFSLFTNLSHS